MTIKNAMDNGIVTGEERELKGVVFEGHGV